MFNRVLFDVSVVKHVDYFNVIKKTKRYDTIPTKNITDTEAHVDQNQDSKIGGESNIFYKFRLAF